MKKFVTIDEYIEIRFTEKGRPTKQTLIKLIKEGVLAGRKFGKQYYIDMEIDSRNATGNILVDNVLGG